MSLLMELISAFKTALKFKILTQKLYFTRHFHLLILKFELNCFTSEDVDGMANSEGTDQSDLGFYCLHRPVQKLGTLWYLK